MCIPLRMKNFGDMKCFIYIFVLMYFCTGGAINCWVCSTDTDQRCNDPMNMTKGAIEDCSRAPHSSFLKPVCKKQKQRGTFIFFFSDENFTDVMDIKHENILRNVRALKHDQVYSPRRHGNVL